MESTSNELGEKLTAVFLTQEEAERFVAFHKYYALVGLLDSLKVLDIRNGSITINFDKIGQIGTIEKHEQFRL